MRTAVVLGIAAALVAILSAQVGSSDFFATDHLEFQGRQLEVGRSRAEALSALGPNSKVIQKPKAYTTEKLLKEAALMRRLAPGSAAYVEAFEAVAHDCGRCWVEIVERSLGDKQKLRLWLMGDSKDSLDLAMIIYDRDRAVMKQMYSDGFEGVTYVDLDGEVYRVVMTAGLIQVRRVE